MINIQTLYDEIKTIDKQIEDLQKEKRNTNIFIRAMLISKIEKENKKFDLPEILIQYNKEVPYDYWCDIKSKFWEEYKKYNIRPSSFYDQDLNEDILEFRCYSNDSMFQLNLLKDAITKILPHQKNKVWRIFESSLSEHGIYELDCSEYEKNIYKLNITVYSDTRPIEVFTSLSDALMYIQKYHPYHR